MSRKKKEQKNGQVVIYQAKSGAIELRGDFTRATIWASRMQMAEMFDVNPQAISKHVQNIYREKELQKGATSSKMELVQNESGRQVRRRVDIYDLDVLIAVGYRINSVVGTKFRQWATKTLRGHIVDGFSVNKGRIAKNYARFLGVVEDIKKILPAGHVVGAGDAIELVSAFADTWLSLDAYDKDTLRTKGVTKKEVTLTADILEKALAGFKDSLVKKGEATELFGQEKQSGAIGGIVGNVMQSFGGKDLYPTVEEKAAHVFYFTVKNHPFNDGNKRSGAYAFIWFLNKAGILDRARMSPPALTALTLFVAESNPTHKDRIVHLILQLLGK